MNVTLRDYQIQAIADIVNAWNDCKSVLFQMPTGTGKTTLFCEIVRMFTSQIYPNKKVLIVTHRKELVEQVFQRLVTDFNLTTGIISSSYLGIQSAAVQVASIQTLIRRPFHQKDIFSVVIIDEAHHALASTYKKLWQFYPSSKFLGVTATPIRTNGEGFADLFDKLILTPSVKWFINNKYLADIRYYASHVPDLSNIKMRSGDYDESELSEVMEDKAVMADLVQSYIDFARDKKMIVFAVNRSHCSKIVERFNKSGFRARAIDTYTDMEERRKIVDDFRNSEFKILCNVNIFTEGFDCPDVDCVQLARPTKSLTLFLQQVGRCMRPHINKEYGIILDNAGLWKEHGLPKMDRNWSLEDVNTNICPNKTAIIGFSELSNRDGKEPSESTGIRLIEVGELEPRKLLNSIEYNSIEKKFINYKIATMRDRLDELVDQIEELENRIGQEPKNWIKEILNKELLLLKNELLNLEQTLKPKRFEQIMEIITEKCHEIIDNNDIFIDGDKDDFLKFFIEPQLSLKNFIGKNNTSTSNDLSTNKIDAPERINTLGVEIFHDFSRVGKRTKAIYNRSTGKITYNGTPNLSPSAAAIAANADITGKKTSLNGWIFWKYLDNGFERTIEELKMKRG
jgi:superfamily II DNA or RNA helicase